MRPTRSVVTGAAVWLLVVAVGSALVWLVISRAGEGVVSSDAPVTTASDQPGRTADPTASPTGSASTPPPDGSPAPQAVRRTWQGAGGLVIVECRGSAASLVNALPDSGFMAEIDDRGPDRVRVEFEGNGDDGGRSRIEATCVGGTPTFETDIDSD